jgi:hypothetical protein
MMPAQLMQLAQISDFRPRILSKADAGWRFIHRTRNPPRQQVKWSRRLAYLRRRVLYRKNQCEVELSVHGQENAEFANSVPAKGHQGNFEFSALNGLRNRKADFYESTI